MTIQPSTTAAQSRPGFTLLEVLLTLSLTSMVLVALAMAIDFQLRVVERSRRNVEEAQLARVLMRRMADDLRGAVATDPTDMQKLIEEAAFSAVSSSGESAQGAATDTGGESSALDSASGPSGSDSGASASERDAPEGSEAASEETGESESGETLDQTESLVEPSQPRLVGEAEWIRLDVGRVPRIDQFEYQVTYSEDNTTADRLSDVKTVTYYVIPPEEGVLQYEVDGVESSGGLVRRELDRAAASWASDEDSLDPTADTDAEPLATEVAAIEFRYFDGIEWVESWDSNEAGALPAAVEITLWIAPFSNRNQPASWSTEAELTAPEEESWLVYQRVVRLPAARDSSEGEYDEGLYGEEEMDSGESAEADSMGSGSAGEEATR